MAGVEEARGARHRDKEKKEIRGNRLKNEKAGEVREPAKAALQGKGAKTTPLLAMNRLPRSREGWHSVLHGILEQHEAWRCRVGLWRSVKLKVGNVLWVFVNCHSENLVYTG